MAGALISIVQQKGGAGKTTLTAQLAIAFNQLKKRVALLDLDPQASLTTWFEMRQHCRGKPGKRLLMKPTAGDLALTIDNLREHADLVLVDGPSHADAETRIAIRLAELVLIPCQPRPLDVWATRHVLNLAGCARRQAMLVLNRVPARSRMAERIRHQMTSNRWPVATHWLGERQAFAATIGIGHGVAEVDPTCRASQEVLSLASEVLAHLGS